MVRDDGTLELPWLAPALRAAASMHRTHALLVHAAPGIGAFEFALALAQSWLCEAQRGAPTDAAAAPHLGPVEPPTRQAERAELAEQAGEGGEGVPAPAIGLACGRCASCRAVQARVHPDLFVLLPQTLRIERAWPLADDRPEEDGKRKPSRQVRIDEVRAAIDWVGQTSARGRGKVWLLHPVEALNEHSASALLKTAEEPPAGTRLVLTCSDPLAILPTVRSRCQRLRLAPPPEAQALAWLQAQGLARAGVLLAACAGRPLDALALARGGVDAAAWEALPAALRDGRPGALAGWPVARALDALFKLARDALARAAGAPTRYFDARAVPAGADPARLAAWVGELQRIGRHAEHPWHEGLMTDALAAGARAALAAGSGPATHLQR
jgi:DNA polymerase-3 subunit delta'